MGTDRNIISHKSGKSHWSESIHHALYMWFPGFKARFLWCWITCYFVL